MEIKYLIYLLNVSKAFFRVSNIMNTKHKNKTYFLQSKQMASLEAFRKKLKNKIK